MPSRSGTVTPIPQGQQGQQEQQGGSSFPNRPEIQDYIDSQIAAGLRHYAEQELQDRRAREQTREAAPAPIRPVEIKIGQPNDYDGNPQTARIWMNQVAMYLTLNAAIYNTDEKKVIFAQSYMKIGTAASWADNRNEKAFVKVDGIQVGWGSFDSWVADFGDTFYFGDHETDSRQALQHMKQTGDIGEYITKFRFHAGNSKITDNSALIGYFQVGIKTALMKQIYAMETVPTTIEGWIKKAQTFENNWKQGQTVSREKYQGGNERTRQNTFNPRPYHGARPRDPNAMDVDRITLSPEEKDRYFKEALCFECGQKGHRAAVCRNRQGPSRPRFNPSRTNIRAADTQRDPKGTAISIKALLEGMTEEEKAATFQTLGEDVDF
jgi:hypothetical protein